MARIAIVGANGFIGTALHDALRRVPGHDISAVTRENYDDMREHAFDILVNAAMPSARFWAKMNPEKDFIETVQKTANLVYGWRFKKFVQVSTVSARCQLDTVYGRHKAAAEMLCATGENLIVRLGPVYGENFKKGVLMDMLQGKKVFADGASRYCFAPVEFIAEWTAAHLDRSGTVEIGARNAIALRDVADHLGGKIEFEGSVDHQEIKDPEKDFPDARDVLAFLDRKKKNLYNRP